MTFLTSQSLIGVRSVMPEQPEKVEDKSVSLSVTVQPNNGEREVKPEQPEKVPDKVVTLLTSQSLIGVRSVIPAQL